MSDNRSQRRRVGESSESGIYNERILILVFASMNWDIRTLCQTASVNRKLRAVARRILWRELCVYRAPQMITALTDGSPSGRIGGGWQAMAKLMFFCNGCQSTRHFQVRESASGHFVKTSRFSKTSGRSFLVKKCRSDLLYVSDPCEHPTGSDDLGLFRGVFWGFMKSRTRASLIRRRVELEEGAKCPFCRARVWSMTAARLIPKSAARRLGSMETGLEYFVCVNGHLYGACWLVPLSSDEGEEKDGDDEDEDEAEDSSEEADQRFDGGCYFRRGNQIVINGCLNYGLTS
ncbi:EID1-like F-box protein 3 [Solanum stenotomum]|uniref:EID1-like F-box protein 3 n=1 Tax=Solanum stenotomum TaxID=172797 RepID=UPI0020D01BD4|nr:EID1-like F-box protein 3 [Solanum stenotomum]